MYASPADQAKTVSVPNARANRTSHSPATAAWTAMLRHGVRRRRQSRRRRGERLLEISESAAPPRRVVGAMGHFARGGGRPRGAYYGVAAILRHAVIVSCTPWAAGQHALQLGLAVKELVLQSPDNMQSEKQIEGVGEISMGGEKQGMQPLFFDRLDLFDPADPRPGDEAVERHRVGRRFLPG